MLTLRKVLISKITFRTNILIYFLKKLEFEISSIYNCCLRLLNSETDIKMNNDSKMKFLG